MVLYATGAGVTSPPSVDGQLTSGVYPAPVQPVTVRIGGQQADVKYAGAAPGLIVIFTAGPPTMGTTNRSELVLAAGTSSGFDE